MVVDLDYSAMVELTDIRGLPILDTKEALMKSMDKVTSAADQYLSALEAQHGVGKAEDEITSTFDQGAEYNLVPQLKKRLHLMLSTVTESGLRVSSSAVTALLAPASGISVLPLVTPRPSAIKIRLPSVSFSGLRRDFASFKKEFKKLWCPADQIWRLALCCEMRCRTSTSICCGTLIYVNIKKRWIFFKRNSVNLNML